MAYVRPCNKCSQKISLRQMPQGQWVAFDASTEEPHKCGKKNKEDPQIKELAKQKKIEQESESVNLGYESEIDKEIEILEDQSENIKKEQERNIKIEKEKIAQKSNYNNEPTPEQEEIISKPNYSVYEKKNKGWEFYFWIFVVALNLLALARCVSE